MGNFYCDLLIMNIGSSRFWTCVLKYIIKCFIHTIKDLIEAICILH